MRNKGAFQAFCHIFPVFIMSMVSFPLYTNGLYQHLDAGTNEFVYCREVLVKRGYEAVPCTKNETEDSVKKCPVGQYQPDQTNSSSSPTCFKEPECAEEEIKEDLKCIDGYCWTVCICNLEVGKCGLNPLNCLNVKNSQCLGEVLQDCSCAPPVVPTKLPTSPPTRSSSSIILKTINPDWTAKTSLPIPTGKPWTVSDSTKTIDKYDTTEDGSDKKNKWIIPVSIGCAFLVVVVVILCICCKRRKNIHMQNGVNKERIRMLETNKADQNIGDKVSEATDSGVCGLSKGSHDNLELGETDSNNINVSNGSDMESGNNSVGDDRDAAQGQSLSQVEVHNDSNSRVETTLAEEEDSHLESDRLLSPNGCAGMRDSSLQSDEYCEPENNNPSHILTTGPVDPDMTHCKETSSSGTNWHHTDADHRTDPDSTPSLCQYVQEKKVPTAVVKPFNQVETVPVEVSPRRENSENQPLRGEGYPEVELDSTNWIALGSSIYRDSTN